MVELRATWPRQLAGKRSSQGSSFCTARSSTWCVTFCMTRRWAARRRCWPSTSSPTCWSSTNVDFPKMWNRRSGRAFSRIPRLDFDIFAPHYCWDIPASERFQPFDDIVIRTMQASTLVVRKDRFGFIERFALRLQVECQVLVGSVDAHVSQPIGNGAEINTGSQ